MSKALTPEVTWAQRSSTDDASKNYVWVTIVAADVSPEAAKIDLQPTSVTFSGFSASKKVDYAVTLDLFAEIEPKESLVHHSARAVELKLQKKELKSEFWPRLLKESKKQHFLKTDFDKWVDEDEQDAVADDDYMNQFGGGAGGMPGGMGGMGGADGGFGGLDFSKLGGAGGMPDLSALGGMGGMGGEGEEEDEEEEDDDDMPDLDEAENAKPSASGSSKKIEEVE